MPVPRPLCSRLMPLLLVVVAWGAGACADLAGAEGSLTGDAAGASAKLQLAAVFGDHMVLQQRASAPFWGWATPGSEVVVSGSWDRVEVSATAGADGRFRLALATPAAGGPYRVSVRAGELSLSLRDVLIGEVWLCGGQSNMEQTLGLGTHAGYGVDDAETVLAGMDLPRLRVFDAAHAIAVDPQSDVTGQWVVSTPENARWFSATASFFALELMAELDVPVGLLCSNWGGTRAEAWMSEQGVAPFPRFAGDLARLAELRADPEGATAALLRERTQWWDALDERDPGSGQPAPWAARELAGDGWIETTQPATFEAMGIGGKDGVVWLRRRVELPADWAGQPLDLHLGPIDDMDTVYWNGERLGGSELPGVWEQPRHYVVPAERVVAGASLLAVRVLDTGGVGGIRGEPDQLRLQRGDDVLPLAGRWTARAGVDLSSLAPFPSQGWFGRDTPTALFNGMLAPLVPYGLRGAIWYQGESNRDRAAEYVELFPALIRDWRRQWGQEFPFYFVQIAPFAYGGDTGQAAAIRDAQRRALSVPGTGMAVTMDIGNPDNIHPTAKQPVGRRLALWALSRTYGRSDLLPSGPLLREVTSEGARLRVHFDFGAGLRARGGPPSHLQIAGEDRVFHPAQGAIDGTTLVVWSDAVSRPVAVRYGWGAADQPNLFGATGLPASSFRSDRW